MDKGKPPLADLAMIRSRTPEDGVAAIRAIGAIRAVDKRDTYERKWVGTGKLRIHRVVLAGCTIRGGKFDDMDIGEGMFDGVLFTGCDFSHTSIKTLDVLDVSFRECRLNQSGMQTVDNLELDEARRIGLRDSDLRGARLRALQELVIVDDAEIDQDTELEVHTLTQFRTWSRGQTPRRIANRVGEGQAFVHTKVPTASVNTLTFVNTLYPKADRGEETILIPEQIQDAAPVRLGQ